MVSSKLQPKHTSSNERIHAIPKQKSFLNRFVATLQASKEKKDALTSYSVASEDSSEIAFADSTYFQKPEGKKELEILYRNNWVIWKCVNVRANLLSSRGMKIVAKNDKGKKAVKELLGRMHPTRPNLALQNSFRNRSINADVFGNGHDELLLTPAGTKEKPADPADATDMLGFTPIHPINIDFQRKDQSDKIAFDKNNIPKGWCFKKDPDADYMGGVKLPLGRVAHLKYNTIGDELLGISSIEPVFKTGERLLKIEEGLAHGVMTYGNPTRDFIVGNAEHPPTKKMLDNTAKEVKGFNFKSEYIHPDWIRVGQLESFSLGKIPNYLQPFITAICAAFGVPEFIVTGRGEGTNKATALAMVEFIRQTIEPLQQEQAMYFEEQILAPYMRIKKVDEIPMIEWNDILPNNIQDYANVIQQLSNVMIGGKQIITYEEAREMAGLGKSVAFKKGEKGKRET